MATIQSLTELYRTQTCLRCQLPECAEGAPGCRLVNIEQKAKRTYWALIKQQRKDNREARRGYHPEIHGELEAA